MKRFLFGMAAVMTGAVATASAGGPIPHGGGSSGRSVSFSNWSGKPAGGFKSTAPFSYGGTKYGTPYKTTGFAYHQSYGKPFSGGYCYPGKYHNHWTYSCYSPKYGCNCYWCPSTCCYYYWCEPACCYYPISYITYAPPCVPTYATPAVAAVQSQSQVQIQVQSQAQTQGVVPTGQPVGPPPGVPPLPQ